jgi:hypothetical protein
MRKTPDGGHYEGAAHMAAQINYKARIARSNDGGLVLIDGSFQCSPPDASNSVFNVCYRVVALCDNYDSQNVHYDIKIYHGL